MMDAKEALKELEDLTVDYGNRNEEQIVRLDEAIDMAMEALRNLPNRLRQAMDTISREAAVEACYNGWNKDYRGIAQDIKDLPSAQPEERTEKRTETHACDCIERQAAIDELYKMLHDCFWADDEELDAVITTLNDLPSAQPTLHGYNIEHLELIARVLQKENLPPERVVEALTDIGRIVAIVSDEFNETLRKAVEQCMT